MSDNSTSVNRQRQRLPAIRRRTGAKLLLVLVLAVAAAFAYYLFGDALSLSGLSRREIELRRFQQERPLVVYASAFLLYVLVTGLSLPGATVMTLAYGWYFGLVRGLLVVSFASTSGATLAFLVSRFLFRDTLRARWGDRLKHFDEALDREGPFYLFTLRLIPAVPFFVINAVMGLTPVRMSTFWWVSQLGMLPGTAVYVYAGASVPGLQLLADQGIHAVFSPGQLRRIILALSLLGLFPLLARYALKRFQKPSPQP